MREGTRIFGVAAYREGLAEHRLMASACNACGELHLPPRPICSACHAQDMAWHEIEGQGTVIGLTSITIAPAAMAERGYGRDNRYVTAVVTLKEGPSVAARIEIEGGEGQDTASAVDVGTPVKPHFVEETVGEKTSTTLVFRPE